MHQPNETNASVTIFFWISKNFCTDPLCFRWPKKRALYWRLAGVLIQIFYILNLPRALIYQSLGPLLSSPCWIVDHKEVYYVHTYIGTYVLTYYFHWWWFTPQSFIYVKWLPTINKGSYLFLTCEKRLQIKLLHQKLSVYKKPKQLWYA